MTIYSYKDIAQLNPYPASDWRRYYFQYMCTREGFLLSVYKDIYGYYTVGIGHLIVASDGIPKQEGYVISKQKVVDLFISDMKRLKVETYTNEIFNVNPFKKIGLASFIWAHGDGEYAPGNTRKLIKTTDNEKTIRAAIASWDKLKPKNQLRNTADFDMFFTGISKHASGILDFTKYFSSTGSALIIAAIGFFFS